MKTCHQHIWSPTSVTNIDVTDFGHLNRFLTVKNSKSNSFILERSSHFETEAVDTIENRKLNDGASYATCSHNRNPPPQSQSEVANNSNNQSCRCYYAFIKPIIQQIHYEISENCKTFKKIVDSKYFGHGIMIAILINTSSMGIGTVETLI